MVILYDWKKIARACKNDPKRMILAFRTMTGELPKNKWDPLYYYYLKDFGGKSFIVNLPKLIEEQFFYTAKEIAEYVALASFRNYSHYALTGDTGLDLLHSPVRQDIITNNRLLSIENGRILFKFEEVTKEKN